MTDEVLVRDLLASLLNKSERGIVFEKRGYQRNLHVLKKATKAIISQLSHSVDAVCALGTSGLGFAVFLAHELSLPLYFYKSEGWPRLKDGRTLFVLPEATKPTRVLLVDSHIRSSYTWAKAERKLAKETNLIPEAIALLFYPDTNELLTGCSVPIISICKASEHADIFHEAWKGKSLPNILASDSDFWGNRSPVNVGAPGNYSRHFIDFIISNPASLPQIRTFDLPNKLVDRIKDIPMSDPDIWKYYLSPSLIQDIAKALGQVFDLSTYKNIVGVSVLGTAFAHSLAYYNIPKLEEMKIFSAYFEKRLIPLPRAHEFDGEDVLLCQKIGRAHV